MIDIVSLSIALGAILISVVSHIRRSRCWCFDLEMNPSGVAGGVPILKAEEQRLLLTGETLDN